MFLAMVLLTAVIEADNAFTLDRVATHVATQVATKMREISPNFMLEYYSCKRGPRGIPGIYGRDGINDLGVDVDMGTMARLIEQGELKAADEWPCDVDAAIDEVFERVVYLVPPAPIEEHWPRGHVGTPGPDGASMSDGLRVELKKRCVRPNVALSKELADMWKPRCPFVDKMVDTLTRFMRERAIETACPDKLMGVAGEQGLRGPSFWEKYPDFSFDLLAEAICPEFFHEEEGGVIVSRGDL